MWSLLLLVMNKLSLCHCICLYLILADEPGINGRRDFNSTVISFTLSAGSDHFDIDMSHIINVDGVNEAKEQFILVLELDGTSDLELDEHRGILVVTILDNNRELTFDSALSFINCVTTFSAIYLHFNLPSYNFSENDGIVSGNIKVQKHIGAPPTEVDIPLKVVTLNGNASNGSGKYSFT